MTHLLYMLKLSALAIIAFFGCLILIIIFPVTPFRLWRRICWGWSRILLFSSGIKVELIGLPEDYIQQNCIVVANHISWIDLILIPSIYWANYVSRIEVKKWFLIGKFITLSGTIFLDRSKKRELIAINQTMVEQLQQGKTIGLFPEGRTTPGDEVIPFKSSLFEAAINAKSKIIPIVLAYYKHDGTRAREVTYCNVNLAHTITQSLRLRRVHAKAFLLPPIMASQFASRDELNKFVYAQIKSKYDEIKELR